MILQEEYNLNLESQLSKKYVKVSQYDTGRRLLITLLKNDCSMFKIPSEASASINGLKPDGKGFRYECSIENNKVVVDMKEQMTVLAGCVKCEILLSKGGERIATANFMLSVEESPLSENTPISSTDIPLLQKAIEASETVLSVEKTVKGYSESASKSSQSAQKSAESASNASASSAESARNSSQSAQASAESANNASQSATNAQESAESASNSATNAKKSAESAIQTKTEVEQLKKETVEQTKTLTDIAKQEISTVKDATVTEVTELKNSTVSEITSLKDSTIEAVTLLKDNAKAEADRATESSTSAKVQAEKAEASADSIANVTSDVEKLKEDLPNKITKFYASNQGEIHLADSDNGKIQDMMIYGKSSQDGTPSIENPVEIKSVVNPTIKVCGKNLLPSNLRYQDRVKMNIKKGVTLTILCKNGLVSIGGNLKFEKANGEPVWFGFDKGKVKQQIRLYDDVVVCNYLIPERLSEDYALYIGDGNTYEPYKEQSIQLPITLNAIPVSSGGNVTINGQQYVADYVDVERGKIVRMCRRKALNTKDGEIDEEYRIRIRLDLKANDGDKECIFSTFKWTNWETCAAGDLVYLKNIKKLNNELYTAQELKELSLDFDVIYQLSNQQETDLTAEQIQALKKLATYYPVTNISVNSEQVEGYTVFNYPISLANGWNYVKQQLNDNRDYIYDMDLQSAEAYVNSEYAVTLIELEV
nr:MAG TPA: L SHAPED TAIL FIBER PROTEIN [Caudoviricetes sp.]